MRPTLFDPTDCSTPVFPVLHISRSLSKLMSIESLIYLTIASASASQGDIYFPFFIYCPGILNNRLHFTLKNVSIWGMNCTVNTYQFPSSLVSMALPKCLTGFIVLLVKLRVSQCSTIDTGGQMILRGRGASSGTAGSAP